ncbi:MAG: hypothetical protein LBR79_06225 [Oscillospiraceae bacterium]|nr:hypothetical protein [Oscillospiraceae bacterium]
MPKVKFTCCANPSELLPLLEREDINAIKGVYTVEFFKGGFGISSNPLDPKYTSASQCLDISQQFYDQLRGISETVE